MMNRRAFFWTVTLGALGALGSLFADEGHPAGRVVRVGVLRPAPDNPVFRRNFEGFRHALREQGYIEGQNLAIDYRLATAPPAVADLAVELVRSMPDVIVALAPAGVAAARNATTAIPIVAIDLESDPVAAGFVATLARPGRNVTGVFLDFPELAGKWLEMLKEAAPRISRVGVLWDPTTGPAQIRAADVAAKSLGLGLQRLEVRGPNDFEGAFRSAVRDQAGALLILSSPVFNTSRKELVDLTIRHRLAAIMAFPDYVDDGGLLAYGPPLVNLFGQVGVIVGKVLKGTPPSVIPVERPIRFELAINLKTAKALGLTIPQSLLVRADRVIE